MLEYNSKTKMDFTEGYDPKSLDKQYREGGIYNKGQTQMPQTIDFAFDIRYSGIEFSSEDVNDLEECLMKYQSKNTTIIYPKELLVTFKKHKIDVDKPSVYSMMKWVADANEFSGTEGMTFEELLTYCAYFFSQRHSEEGLKYVFELFDPERKGELDRK